MTKSQPEGTPCNAGPALQVVLSEQEETDKMDKEREEMMRLRKRRRLDSSGQEISSGSEERVGETMR